MDKEANSSQHNVENLKRKQAIELLENWKEKLKEKNNTNEKKCTK
jgi:predicted metal-dependent hydrolase